MKVSLIVSTYNSPVSLKKVLESLKNQTHPADELLVADDGSDDDTASLVRAFSAQVDFPVLHVWQENRGFRLAKIRNEAIKKSSGEYIIVLDGDCVVNRHYIADHLALSERNCFVQGKRVLVNKSAVEFFDCSCTESPLELFKMGLLGKISNSHHIFRLPFFLSIKNRKLKGIKGCNMSFFRSDIFAVNGYNEDFIGWGNEDSDLAFRFFLYGLRKKVNPFVAICFHLWHPRNHGFTKGNRKLLNTIIHSDEHFCKNGLVKAQ